MQLSNSLIASDSNIGLFDYLVHQSIINKNQFVVQQEYSHNHIIMIINSHWDCRREVEGKSIMMQMSNVWVDYNKIMFEELIALLTPKQQSKSQEEVGKAVDLLKQIEYFQDISSTYGVDYLILLMQTIQPFILRQGFGLINQNDHYIMLSGQLHEEEPQFGSSRPVQEGRVLDLKERQGVVFMAKSDCKMLRIKKGPSAGFHLEKKLTQMQRDRKRSLLQMNKLLGGQSYKQKFKFLQQISFFSELGEYDFLELVGQSEVVQYKNGNITHKYGQNVTKIGCIISGKIKLTIPSKQGRVRGIESHINEGEWLGLQEFIFNNHFQTTGQANSIIAMVVWVPLDIFQSKFNTKTNHSLLNRIKGLIQTKKLLFQRGIQCRQQQQNCQTQQNDRKCLNAKLVQKISTFQFTNQKHRSNFRRAKNNKDMQIPQKIMHRINYNSELTNLASLPKLTQKTILFAQEYKTIPVANIYLKELQRLQKNRNRSIEPKVVRSFTERNPEQLFQTILQKLPRKLNQCPTVTCTKTFRQQKSTFHFNRSIYNNFRVGKQRVLSLVHPPRQTTLDINIK